MPTSFRPGPRCTRVSSRVLLVKDSSWPAGGRHSRRAMGTSRVQHNLPLIVDNQGTRAPWPETHATQQRHIQSRPRLCVPCMHITSKDPRKLHLVLLSCHNSQYIVANVPCPTTPPHPPAPARVPPQACRGVAQTEARQQLHVPPKCRAARCRTRWGSRSSRWCCGGVPPGASAAGAVGHKGHVTAQKHVSGCLGMPTTSRGTFGLLQRTVVAD
jgi:hypothetical protein